MPSTQDSSKKTYIMHIDGASRGNPGPAAFAVVIENPDGSPPASLSGYLGRTTNNVAEYKALLAALDHAVQNRISPVSIVSDSELLVRQIEGRYKVKSPDLRPLYEQAIEKIRQLPGFSIRHVPREQNRQADKLANVVLDQASGSANG